MSLRFLVLLALGTTYSLTGMATTVLERVTPESIPSYIEVEITAWGCDTKASTGDDFGAVWYATVRTKVVDAKGERTVIRVGLRDPQSDAFLFNPGGASHQEGGYELRSIAFDSTILDQVVFEWSNHALAGSINYLIYLTDFYSGERC